MNLFQEYELDLDPGETDHIEATAQPEYWHVYPRASIGSGGVRLCNGPSIKAEGSKEIVGLMSIRLPGRDTKITLENRSSAAVHLFITAARGFHISVERLDPGSGGGGASTFLDLTDSPASYAGQAGKVAAVKSAEDGLEFVAGGSVFALVKYGTFPYSGGWMSGGELADITETALSPSAGSWVDIANLHDNNVGSYAGFNSAVNQYPRMKMDFGQIVGLDRFRIWQSFANDHVSNIWLYGSNTGVFGGEETLVASRGGLVATASWQEMDFVTYGIGPSAWRYWCLKGYRGVTRWWKAYEFSYRWQPSVVFANVPYGVLIEAYNAASALVESHRQENESWSEFVPFTDPTIDRIKIYEPDGVTLFYDTEAGWSWTTGDVWTFWGFS